MTSPDWLAPEHRRSPLAVAAVTAPGAGPPERWLVLLHGILGSGANWRTFARQVTAARPEWGALLVDLRLHGESRPVAPPHTLAAAAGDVVDLIGELPIAVRAVLGHSFGGKVAIEAARRLDVLDHLFVIDSTPGARPDYRGSSGVRDIIELLRELPEELPDRNAFTAWVEGRGVSRPIAMWLALNVRPVPNTTRFKFRIDVPSVRAMMEDYFTVDLWDVLASTSFATHLIAGGRSPVLEPADLERARACPRTTVDVIPDAGHWVHADAPDALRELVLGYLS